VADGAADGAYVGVYDGGFVGSGEWLGAPDGCACVGEIVG
jgi:hypothetical protein